MKEIDVNALFCAINGAYTTVHKANREKPGTDHEIVLRLSDYEKKTEENKK